MKIETARNLLTSSLSRARFARVLVDFRKEKETEVRVQAKFNKLSDVFLIGKSLIVESPLIQTLRVYRYYVSVLSTKKESLEKQNIKNRTLTPTN